MLDFIPRKYRERVKSVETEDELIDGCKYMVYFADGWAYGEFLSIPCKSKDEVLEFVRKAEEYDTSSFREYERREKQLFIESEAHLFAELLVVRLDYYKRLSKKDVVDTYESLYDTWCYTNEEKQYIYNKGLELAHINNGIDISKWKD